MEFWLGLMFGWLASVAIHAAVEAFTGKRAMPERWRREQWRDHDRP